LHKISGPIHIIFNTKSLFVIVLTNMVEKNQVDTWCIFVIYLYGW